MTELETKLNEIKDEKETKIIPENIKKDVQIFDVTGTYEGGGGADLSEYFEKSVAGGVSANNARNNCVLRLIKKVPVELEQNNSDFGYAFYAWTSLIETPKIKNNNLLTVFQYGFYGCSNLEDVRVYNFSSMINLSNMFGQCPKLTNASLDNILQSCISTTSAYTGTKTLATLGLNSTNYPVATIEALPHYSDFRTAGWSIGY